MSAHPKSIIITGAGSGIGRACAETFLKDGWRVGLIGRREDPLREVAADFDNALVLPCDVTDAAQVEAAFQAVVAKWGRLDALFNNAGVMPKGSLIDEVSVEDWRAALDVNLTGAFICARAAFSAMRKQDPQGGRIINNGSISAHAPRPGSVCYTSAKHAMTGLTKTLSLDGRPFDIACGQIDIGNALTELAKTMSTGILQPNGSVEVEAMMDVAHVATSVLHMSELPLDTNVQFMTIMATKMPFIARG